MAPRWGGLRPEPYDPDARDADGDGVVQEQTAWERPVGTNLVDELGRAITRGSNVGARPRGMRVVDSRGNNVDYTPTYARPGAAPGAERVGGATALSDHGAGSLKERGLPTVRAAAAPRVPEPEVAPEQITQADAPEAPALRVDGRPKASAKEMAEASRIAKSIQESVEAEFGPLTTKQQVRDALNRAFPTASGNAEALLNSAEAWDENTPRVKAVRNFAIGLLYMSQQDPQTAARITRLTDLDTKDPNHGGTHSPRADIYNGTFQSWTISMNPSLNVNSLEPEKREMGEPWAYKMALSMKETGDFSDDEINQILQQSVAIHEFGHAMHLSAGLSHWGNDRGGAIPSEAMIQAFANVKKISVSDANDEINAFIQKYDTRGRSDQTISAAITTLVRREPEGEQAFFNELYDTIKWDGVDKDETTRAKILEDLSKASEYATTGGKRGMGSQYDEGVAETIAVMVATGTPASGGKETIAHVQSIFPGSAAASADQSKPDTPSAPGPDLDKPTSPTESKPKLTSPEAIKADIKPGTEDDLVGEKSLEVGNELTERILASREEADQSWRDVTVVTRDGQTVEIRRDASPDNGMPIIDVMGAEAPDIKMQNAREVGRLLSEDLSLEEMQGFLPESVEVTISKNGIVRLVSTKDVPPGQEQIQILVNTPTEANYREAIRRGDIIVVDPTTDDYKGLLAEGIASKLIEGWATMEGAEELHRSAERVFGTVDPMRSQVDEDPARQKVIDAMMMATYKNTQRRFQEQGITEIVLHRGMRLTPKDSPLGEYIYSRKSPDVTEFQEELDISLRPLSSFSYNLDTARYSFGEYGAPGGTVMTSTIPVERIISTATTAFGCREEDEIMVIGGGNISTTLRWTLERKSTGQM